MRAWYRAGRPDAGGLPCRYTARMSCETSKIGVCSWSLQPVDCEQLASRVRECGVCAVQLALNPMADGEPGWEGTIDCLRQAGIEILSGMMAARGEDYSTLEAIGATGGVRPDTTWADNQQLAQRVADIAAANDIKLVTFHLGFLPEQADHPERAKLVKRVQWVADMFVAKKLDLAFETGQESAATLLAVLSEINRPNVGVNFDPANMLLYGMGDPIEAITTLKDHVKQIHIKDAHPSDTPGQWGTETPVGEGSVDWPAFFKVATSITPAVNYIIEREAGGSRIGDVKRGIQLVQQHCSDIKTPTQASV